MLSDAAETLNFAKSIAFTDAKKEGQSKFILHTILCKIDKVFFRANIFFQCIYNNLEFIYIFRGCKKYKKDTAFQESTIICSTHQSVL